MSAWPVVLLAGAVSLGLRFAPVVLTRGEPPGWLRRCSGYVLPAAFAALATSSVAGTVEAGLTEALPTIVGVLAAGVVAWRRSSGTAALVAGLPALWLTTALLR